MRSINLQTTTEMKAKRRRHNGAFRARVALETMKEEKTIHQIAKDNDVHPTQVTEWKKRLAENIASAFERGKPRRHDRSPVFVTVLMRELGEQSACW
jgi:transposase